MASVAVRLGQSARKDRPRLPPLVIGGTRPITPAWPACQPRPYTRAGSAHQRGRADEFNPALKYIVVRGVHTSDSPGAAPANRAKALADWPSANPQSCLPVHPASTPSLSVILRSQRPARHVLGVATNTGTICVKGRPLASRRCRRAGTPVALDRAPQMIRSEMLPQVTPDTPSITPSKNAVPGYRSAPCRTTAAAEQHCPGGWIHCRWSGCLRDKAPELKRQAGKLPDAHFQI